MLRVFLLINNKLQRNVKLSREPIEAMGTMPYTLRQPRVGLITLLRFFSGKTKFSGVFYARDRRDCGNLPEPVSSFSRPRWVPG
jgi:hypothetical protein